MKCHQLSLVDVQMSKIEHSPTYPLVNIQKAIENGHRNSGFSHWKWWFSIAMLNYQRVPVFRWCCFFPASLIEDFPAMVDYGRLDLWKSQTYITIFISKNTPRYSPYTNYITTWLVFSGNFTKWYPHYIPKDTPLSVFNLCPRHRFRMKKIPKKMPGYLYGFWDPMWFWTTDMRI